MKCEHVQEKLSEYLDGFLDRDTSSLIQSHLTSCSRCQAELQALAEAKRSVAGLPVIEPPPGFSQRVMSRVREEAERPNLFRRLFLPMHIKIPIHALALLLVGGVAVYLYYTYRPVQPVAVKSTPSASERMAKQEQNAPAGPPQEKTESFAPSPMEKKLKENTMDEAGRATAKTGKLEGAAGGIAAATPPAKVAVDYKLSVTALGQFNDAKIMNSKLEELAKRMGGKYIRSVDKIGALERDAPHPTETVWIVIPADQYDRLKNELAALGKIEEETRMAPSSPESAAPSAPRPPADISPFLSIQLTLRLAVNP
jgi:anti-sigma factor RsiW